MECQTCNVKSSVGFCVTCKSMLCEECGIKCDECKRLACRAHIQRTGSGKQLCLTCYELRREKKREKRGDAGDTSFAALSGAPKPAEAPDETPDEEIVLGKWQPPPPWKISIYTASIGLAATIFITVIPALRKIILPGGDYIATPYILVLIPVMALLWAAVGFYQEKYIQERMRSLPGVVIAIINIALCFAVVQFDVKLPEPTDSNQSVRAEMDAKELEDWRNNILDKFEK